MKRARKFTILHGLAASIAIHAVLGLPIIARVFAAPPEEEPLLIELQGAAPDSQDISEIKQSELDQMRGQPVPPQPDVPVPKNESPRQEAAPSDTPPLKVTTEETPFDQPQPATKPLSRPVETPPPTPQQKAGPDDNTANGANEYVPPSWKSVQVEMTDEEYSALLFKKVGNNLVYPDEAKRARLEGVTTVSFVILASGEIRPGTLKVVKSSGHPALDAGALNTIRASAPFDAPPKEMSISLDVSFGPKR
jgi:periplasmic protein TonB